MKELKKHKIIIGATYKNRWNDLLIPILVKENRYKVSGFDMGHWQVCYIKKGNDGEWSHNPYTYSVSEHQFLLKNSLVDEIEIVPIAKLQKILDIVLKTNMDFDRLLVNCSTGLEEVMNYEATGN